MCWPAWTSCWHRPPSLRADTPGPGRGLHWPGMPPPATAATNAAEESRQAWVVVWACFVALAVIFGVSYSFAAFFESYANALAGKYVLSCLKSRPEAAQIPKVDIVDMRIEFERNKGFTHFSSKLLDGIKSRMEKGEQTILFLVMIFHRFTNVGTRQSGKNKSLNSTSK